MQFQENNYRTLREKKFGNPEKLYVVKLEDIWFSISYTLSLLRVLSLQIEFHEYLVFLNIFHSRKFLSCCVTQKSIRII